MSQFDNYQTNEIHAEFQTFIFAINFHLALALEIVGVPQV